MTTLNHSAVPPQAGHPRLASDALIGIAGRVVGRCAGIGHEDVVLGFWLAALSAHLGRRVGVRVGGRLIWPNIHVGTADWSRAQGSLQAVLKFFEPYPPQPRIIGSGIRDAESLIHVIRDAVVRADRIQIPRVGTIFQNVMVDTGESERRVLLIQNLHSLLDRRRLASKNLLAALLTAFEGGALNCFVGRGGVRPRVLCFLWESSNLLPFFGNP